LDQRAVRVNDATEASKLQHDGTWHEWGTALHQAVSRLDTTRLAQIYGLAVSTYSVNSVLQDIFMPVWHELLKDRRFGRASQWSFLDAFLRARIWQRLQLSDNAGEHRALIAAVRSQCHELEL